MSTLTPEGVFNAHHYLSFGHAPCVKNRCSCKRHDNHPKHCCNCHTKVCSK